MDNDETKNVIWTNIIEQNVKEIGEKSKGYKIMHIQQARNITLKYKLLMYTGIILGPLAGLLSSLAVISSSSNTSIELSIASACVSFISGIVIAVTKYGKFEEKSSHHKITASKYTSLESNVRRQLVLSREDRINAVQYLDYVGSSFDELFMSSPLVANNIYKNYVKIAKENGIIVPDEYGITINMNESYQNNKLNELKNVSAVDINNNYLLLSSDKENNQKSYNKIISTEEKIFKGDKEIKRTGTFTNFPELNKYSDGRMLYEMERMMGLR